MPNITRILHFVFYVLRTTYYVLLLTPLTVLAQTPFKNPIAPIETIPQLIGKVIGGFFIPGAGVIALIFFVMGGFEWMTSGGNDEKVTKGKDMMLWATLGIIAIFLSYAFINMILLSIFNK